MINNTQTTPQEKPVSPADSKVYNRIKLRLTIIDIVLNMVFLAVLAFSGISSEVSAFARGLVSNIYLQFLVFFLIISLAYSVLDFPFGFYGSFILEHRFGLSNQTFLQWLWEKTKSTFIALVIGVPVSLVFYYLLIAAGDTWWLYFSIFVFIISVILAQVAPVIIFPLFYKFRELEEGEVKERISDMLKVHEVPIKGIYSFNMSKDTKKANAGFTGIGKTKRIILSDTLLENFTPAEIEVIFAHEMGHYKKKHIVKNIIFSTAVIFITFYLCSVAYKATIAAMGLGAIHDLAALPVLLVYLTLTGLVLMPVTNALSRYYEVQADSFALDVSRDHDAFISSMEKLADMNLADKEPHPVNEFFFYSHPSIGKRIAFAREYNVNQP